MMQSVRCSLLTGSGCNISGLFCSLKVLPSQRLCVVLSPLCSLQSRSRDDCLKTGVIQWSLPLTLDGVLILTGNEGVLACHAENAGLLFP